MRDGAHIHHGHSGPSGFGLVLSIAGGLVLASVIESILPVLLIVLAVVAGLLVLGLAARAVTAWSQLNPAARPGQYPDLPAADDQQAPMVTPGAMAGLSAQHQHVHFHGLDPAQVAAILAARRERDGDAW